MLWSHCGNKSMAQTHQASFSPQRISYELATKSLPSSLTFCLPNFLLSKQHLKHYLFPCLLSLQLLTYPDFKHFLFLVHTSSNILPQYQVMTETGNCHFLKPLPSDHLKPPQLTYMFIFSSESFASEQYLGGWNSDLHPVPWACCSVFSVFFLSSDSWWSISKYSPPCFTELIWCLPKIITSWSVYYRHIIKSINFSVAHQLIF